MAKRPKSAIKLTRLEARVRFLDGAGRLAFLACCVAIGFVVVATAFPQHRELVKLEAKLELAKQREAGVMADKEYHEIEYQAVREDPAFLEIHARDRLDYFREGERVFRFQEGE